MNFLDPILSFFSLIFWFVIILVPIVAIHEFGHLTMARLFGVKVPEYAIGFPFTKRLFEKRWKGIIWAFYPVLIGGFVRILGDNDAIDNASDKHKTDPELATKDYLKERFDEIIANRELKYFIEDNNIEWTKDWQAFAESKYIRGEEGDDEKDKELFKKKYKQVLTLISWELEVRLESKDTFFSKNLFQQIMILIGGVSFNFLTVIVIFWTLFTILPSQLTQLSQEEWNVIRPNAEIIFESEYVKVSGVAGTQEDPSPAFTAGLKGGDGLISFDGVEINSLTSFEEFKDLVAKNVNQEVEIIFQSENAESPTTAKITIQEINGRPIFGIGPLYKDVEFKAKGPFAGIRMALDQTWFLTVGTFNALGDIVSALSPTAKDRSALNSLAGPIAVSDVSSSVYESFGYRGILQIMALVSLSLGIFNLLPIPALDGGRIIIAIINKILGKRNRKLEGAIISTTFLLMMVLAIFVAINDIRRIVS